MSPPLALALSLLLGAEVVVPAGASLGEALERLGPGDVLRLGPGVHRGGLGRPGAGLVVRGAGAGLTVVEALPGEDGAVAVGALSLSGLTLVAGPGRSGLKVLGGAVRLEDVALSGGSAGLFVESGRVEGLGVLLEGEYGLLQSRGEVALTGLTATGGAAGLALLGGTLVVARATVTGPSREAAITVAGGAARLAELIVRDPGPTGLAVSGGEVIGRDLTVAGPRARRGLGGACLQVRRGTLRLSSSELVACGGAALEASRASVVLDGVDAGGGEVGGLIFTDHSSAELSATLTTGHGPGLVVMQGSQVSAFGARFWVQPAIWADCASGARVRLLHDPQARQPCAAVP
ncbi:MAG: hypothetical protein IPO09_17160 [Anaeromyxobacter sp.]|nr:hypothetical protein [Anaeromyxobacter sp.]MBL0276566.1 hypothetical protein [Anaeromyxobacter sp.]